MKKIFGMPSELFLLLLSVMTFFLVEILNDDIWFFQAAGQRGYYFAVNLVIYFAIYLFLYGLSGSVRITAIFGLIALNLIGMVNYFVCEFRGTAFKIADVLSIKTAEDVAGMYRFSVSSAHVIWAVVLFLTILLVFFYIKYGTHQEKKQTIRRRIGSVCISLCIFVVCFQVDLYKGSGKAFDSWNTGGYMVYFFDKLSIKGNGMPDAYDSTKYSDIGALDMQAAEKKEMPNIIVLMNESFSDIQRITDIHTNKEVMPFFKELIKGDNIIEGETYVSVFGGNTSNTEMEFLTGSTMGFWGEDTVCYNDGFSADLDVLPKWLNQLGYATYAVHPAKPTNYNRDSVYKKMQFSNTRFIDDFQSYGAANQSAGESKLVGDRENYTYLEDIIHKEESPLFVFNVTIQNHGGYQWRGINDVKITEPIANQSDYQQINEYLTLLNESDRALEQFITDLKKSDEKTIVLFFGDHQSMITYLLEKNLKKELQQKDYYRTPFFIWANYDIETEHNVTTSINYLQNMLLEASGIGLLNEYQNKIAQVQKEFPVFNPIYSEDKNRNEVSFEQILRENEMVRDYHGQAYKLIYDAEK